MLILWMFAALVYSQNESRLNQSSQDCQIYINKFYTGISQLPSMVYSVEGQFYDMSMFDGPKGNTVYKFYYFDPLVKDHEYFGLTQEDGKFQNQTCLDLKIWRFTSDEFSDPKIQECRCDLFAHSHYFNKDNYSSFECSYHESCHNEITIPSTNSVYNVYNGYWALAYYLVGADKELFKFYFTFTIIIQPSDETCDYWCFSTPISFNVHPLNFLETVNCSLQQNNNCTILYSTQLKWCIDSKCQSFIDNPQIIQNQSFYLLQIVNQSEFMNYYLVNSIAYLKGEGLDYKLYPLTTQNSQKGQVILQLKTPIVWSKNVQILITSHLMSSLVDQSQPQLYPVSGLTKEIQCIYMSSNSTDCPNCNDEFSTNRFANSECGSHLIFQISFIFYLAWLILG